MNRRCVSAAIVCAALLPAAAGSTVIPVAQSRVVSTFAFLDPGTGQEPLRSDETIQSGEGGPFAEHAVCHVEQSGSHVTALADQESSIGPEGVSARIGISAEGRLVPPAQGTLGLASSSVSHDFDVDTPTTCRLTAVLEATGGGVVDIAIRVRNGGYVVRWQFSETQENLVHDEVLPPGEYQLTAGAGGDGATGPNGTGASFVSMDFGMSFPDAAAVGDVKSPPAGPVAYPNPASHQVTFYHPGGINAGSVRIFDAAGRVVRELGADAGARRTWDTRDTNGTPVPRGVYFLVWQDGSKANVTVTGRP